VPGPAAAPASAVPGRPRLRTALAYALPLLVLLGSGIGSLAYAKASADGADRTVATDLWDSERSGPARPESDYGKGSTSGRLQRQLLPVPEGYQLGPYMTEDANDVELGSRAIDDLVTGGGIAAGADAENKRLEKLLREAAPRAVALRSYTTPQADAVYYVTLSQNKEGKSTSAHVKSALKALKGALGAGPSVPGHAKDAGCFMAGGASGVAALSCLGGHGDLLVSMTVAGSGLLDRDAATSFFSRQLDRLKSTGTAV
jgi:hypothetical protein